MWWIFIYSVLEAAYVLNERQQCADFGKYYSLFVYVYVMYVNKLSKSNK
jgi:hypothetical protein